MGNNIFNVARIQQDAINNITQSSRSTCSSITTNNASGNVFVISGTTLDGTVVGSVASVQSDASCIMLTDMESNVENILTAQANQNITALTSLLNDLSVNSYNNLFNLTQTFVNNINQINESTCSANTMISTNNNYFYVIDSTVTNSFIGTRSDSQTNASCSITNYVKNRAFNEGQASVDQDATVKGTIPVLIGAITTIAILIIIAIVAVILIAGGTVAAVGGASVLSGAIGSSREPTVDISTLQPYLNTPQQRVVQPPSYYASNLSPIPSVSRL
jgi:hypothetical protein